jgi:hypothetical protein
MTAPENLFDDGTMVLEPETLFSKASITEFTEALLRLSDRMRDKESTISIVGGVVSYERMPMQDYTALMRESNIFWTLFRGLSALVPVNPHNQQGSSPSFSSIFQGFTDSGSSTDDDAEIEEPKESDAEAETKAKKPRKRKGH